MQGIVSKEIIFVFSAGKVTNNISYMKQKKASNLMSDANFE